MPDTSIDRSENSLPAYPSDDAALLLPGWPGYRTRPGRSGLDYIDTQIEVAHMAGIFLRQLFSGRWLRRRNVLHPFVVIVVGVALLIASVGSEGACIGIPVVLLVALFAAIRARNNPQDIEEPEDMPETSDNEEAAGDELGPEEEDEQSSESEI